VTEGRVAEGCVGDSSSSGVATGPTLVDLDQWSSLCSTGHTPNIITGALLRFLQEHFSQPDKIENLALRDNVWRDNPSDTTEGLPPKGILINPVYEWNPRDFDRRLAIYIARNAMTVQRLGINDGLTTGLGKDPKTGELKTDEGEYHVVGVQGSHTLFCIGRAGAEVEIMGTEVWREVLHFSPLLRKDLKLKRLVVSEASPIANLQEYDQHYVVTVAVGWYYFEKWRLRPVAPWLKTISIGAQASE
jgi:hypothetical protein